MNCLASCGSIGQPGTKCTYVCPNCKEKCHGNFAKSLSESIGKCAFICKCIYNNNEQSFECSFFPISGPSYTLSGTSFQDEYYNHDIHQPSGHGPIKKRIRSDDNAISLYH